MRGVVARVARALLPAALPVVLASCDSKVDAADEAPPALRAALAARTIYPAKREEWRSDITAYTDSTMVPRVFRASLTTVALLQSMPTRISLFELNGKGMLLSTRPARIDSVLNAEVPRDIVAPSDLSRVTDDGNVDVVDSATSTLVRESIGGFVFRRELPLLRGGSGQICTVAPATLMHLRLLGERRIFETFTLTGNAKDDALTGRHRIVGEPSARLRFGNGDVRRCLLLTEREVLIVSVPPTDSVGAPPHVTRLTPPGGSPARVTIEAIDAPANARTDSAAVQQPFVVDAAIVDGGFVVLVGVSSDRQGRIIDYYNEQGAYIQSAMLPFTASAMTGTGPRFLALHQDDKYRWWLSSWVTPMAAKGAEPAPQPPPIGQAPERRLFEPPGKLKQRP